MSKNFPLTANEAFQLVDKRGWGELVGEVKPLADGWLFPVEDTFLSQGVTGVRVRFVPDGCMTHIEITAVDAAGKFMHSL